MGTRSMTGLFKAQFQATIKNLLDANSTGEPSVTIDNIESQTITSGTGDDQFDRAIWQQGRTLTSASSENWDMFDLAAFDIGAGAGNDALGQAWGCVEIGALLVVNQSGSAGNVVIGNDGTAAAWNSLFDGSDTATLTIKPGGFLFYFQPNDGDGLAVADTTNHLLKVLASGGNVTYDFYAAGRSA